MNLQELRNSNNGKLPAYAWPGGYPILYYANDGHVFCPDCANQEKAEPEISFYDIYYEGPVMYCEGCAKEIESAYGDPNEDEE